MPSRPPAKEGGDHNDHPEHVDPSGRIAEPGHAHGQARGEYDEERDPLEPHAALAPEVLQGDDAMSRRILWPCGGEVQWPS